MDRRTAAGTIFGVLAPSGAAALIGVTAVSAENPYFDILLIAGIAGLAVGLGGLFWLWWTGKPRAVAREPESSRELATVRIREAKSVDLDGNETRSALLYEGDSVGEFRASRNIVGGKEPDDGGEEGSEGNS